MPVKALDKFMKNVGLPQFSFDTFQMSFDSDAKIQSIVQDFDQEYINLKTDEFEPKKGNDQSANRVSQMAKRAVDL